MMGLHPCSVKENYQRELGIIEQKLKDNKYVAIGEIGIDLHWDKSTLTWQEDAFRQQILWAKEMGLPIVIHARESFDEIFAVVDEMNDDRLTGIFHCFTGTPAQAEKIIDYGGFMLGLGGVLTYKNSGLAETIKNIDPGYVILETDAPYLSPVPYRGKRNEPSYMVEVAKRLALAWEISYDQVVSQSEENTKRIFSLKTFDSYKNR
jgi:TatD DNase family protein